VFFVCERTSINSQRKNIDSFFFWILTQTPIFHYLFNQLKPHIGVFTTKKQKKITSSTNQHINKVMSSTTKKKTTHIFEVSLFFLTTYFFFHMFFPLSLSPSPLAFPLLSFPLISKEFETQINAEELRSHTLATLLMEFIIAAVLKSTFFSLA